MLELWLQGMRGRIAATAAVYYHNRYYTWISKPYEKCWITSDRLPSNLENPKG